MNGRQTVVAHWRRWAVAALLAVASAVVFELPVLLGRDVIGWPTTLAAAAVLAGAVLLVMQDARRRTFAWMAGLALPIFIAAVAVHNVEYAITGVEEPTFILVAILGGPMLLLAGLGGLVWTSIREQHASQSSGGAVSPLA